MWFQHVCMHVLLQRDKLIWFYARDKGWWIVFWQRYSGGQQLSLVEYRDTVWSNSFNWISKSLVGSYWQEAVWYNRTCCEKNTGPRCNVVVWHHRPYHIAVRTAMSDKQCGFLWHSHTVNCEEVWSFSVIHAHGHRSCPLRLSDFHTVCVHSPADLPPSLHCIFHILVYCILTWDLLLDAVD